MFLLLLGILILLRFFLGSQMFSFISESKAVDAPNLQNALAQAYTFPALPLSTTPSDWLNSKPLTQEDLKGKVVLIDFWTYSCINCIRTLPQITSWDKKYRKAGLVIIGVHAPEFDFEKRLDNVKMAIEKYGIKYPVVMDNDYKIWKAFNNHAWPAHYLIDRNGNVVYTHFGEGQYDVTENNIRVLLGMKATDMNKASVPISPLQSPETYLGIARAANFVSPEGMTEGKSISFTFPNALALNQWALKGKWTVTGEYVESMNKGDQLRYHFNAKKVFLVISNTPKSGASLRVIQETNGKHLERELKLDHDNLYELVNLKDFSDGILTIEFPVAGIRAHAFTFEG